MQKKLKNDNPQTVLLDTDYVINFLRGVPGYKEIIVPLWEQNIAFLSLLSAYELYTGMRPGEENATDNFIHACQIEPLTLDISKKAGDYRRTHQQRGITLSIIDCLIAETARSNNHMIATNNIKHFPESLILKRQHH